MYLALDQGGHASRALLFDANGHCVAQSFATIATHTNALGHVEHDADELAESLRTVLADIAPRAKGVVAAGLATQRSTIVCWDSETGEALSPAISWQDRRNAGWLERLKTQNAEVHALTGLVMSPHYGASKLRWCVDHLPRVSAASRNGRLRCGPLASFLLRRLLVEGPAICDPANASRTLLWDPSTLDWSPRLLQLFGIARDWLPQSVATVAAHGTLVCGEHRLPLRVCTGDQSAVPYAFGPADRETVYVNLGTGAFLQRPLGPTFEFLPPLLTSVVRADAGGAEYVLEGTVNGAGAALAWLAERDGDEVLRLAEALGIDDFADVAGPFFINGVGGIGSPFWVPQLDSHFTDEGSLRARVRAVVESMLFLLRANLDEMARRGRPARRLVVTGGLATSDALCATLADLTGIGVERPAEREATARGVAALLAGPPASWSAARDHAVFAPHSDRAIGARYLAWLELMRHELAAAELRRVSRA